MKRNTPLLAVALIAALIMTPAAFAGTRIWKGGANGLWSNPANWDGGVPMPGDDVVFPASASSENDLPAFIQLHSLTSGSAVKIKGNPIVLGEGGLFTEGPNAPTLSMDLGFSNILLGASQTWSSPEFSTQTTVGPTEINGQTLRLNISPKLLLRGVSGTGTIVQESGGTEVTFGATSTFIGTLIVNGGSFRTGGTAGEAEVNGSGILTLIAANAGGITVRDGGTLKLQGNLQTRGLTFTAGGAPAHLQRAEVFVQGAGPTISVQGAVALTNAQLGNVFPINNDGVDPVAGTFLGLPEGAVFTEVNYYNIAGASYRISYIGGDGNDVVFTPLANRAADTYTTLSVSSSLAQPGQPVTFTATAATIAGKIAGTVGFYDGGVLIASVPIDGAGQAKLTTALATGTHHITAGFSSDADFSASQATVRVNVLRSRTRAVHSSSR